MKSGVSIIVCCYNSALKLPQTLQCLAAQKQDTIDIEVILVDNNSVDNTSTVAESFWESNSLYKTMPLLVVKESRPGLSFARDAGVKQANYDLIVFCDDDNWLNEDYCQRAYELMYGNTSIGVLGGLNTAVGEIELPHWFKRLEQSYACGPQHDCDGEVSRMYVTGAGMVVRKHLFDLLKTLKFESQLTDRSGEELSSGGDSEICFIALLLGYKLFYSSKLKLSHFMEEKRLKWSYFIKMSLGHAESSYKLRYYFDESCKDEWLPELFRILKPIFGKRILVLLRDYLYSKRRIASNEKVHHMILFGQIIAHVKMYSNYAIFIQNIKSLKNRIANIDTIFT